MNALIPLMIFLPALGALLQTANARPVVCRTLAVATSGASAVLAVVLFAQSIGLAEGEALLFVTPWMRSYSIHFALGIDGLNLLPVLALALVFPVLIFSEWDRQFGRRGIHALFLLLESAALGALCSQDLFLLLFFFCAIPIPLYFLASIWGEEGREASAYRMISVALVAGACLFFGVLLVYHSVDPHSFLLDDLRGKMSGHETSIFGASVALDRLAFPLIVLGLLLRAPAWPLHGWVRRLVMKAPATVAVATLVAGFPVAITVLMRVGFTLFPERMASTLPFWVGLGLANLAFGTLSLLQEKDLRGLLVSLSTVFSGLALIGVGTGNAQGLIGSQFILFSAALSLAVLGFASELLRRRTRSYSLSDHAGALRQVPDLGICSVLAIACGLGVPGTVGFIAFGLLLMGAFAYNPGVVIGALVAIVLVTGYLIQVYRGVFLGDPGEARYPALGLRERFLILPLTAAFILTGFFPSPFVDSVRASVVALLSGGGEIAPAVAPEPEPVATPSVRPSFAPGEPIIPTPTPSASSGEIEEE